MAHVVDGHLNRAGGIGNRLQLDARRQFCAQAVNRLVQAFDHFNRIFVLRFLHRKHQGALTVVQRQTLDLLRAVVHLCKLPQSHRCTLALRHDDVGKLLRPLNARVHLHHTFLLQRTNAAHRQVLVFTAHRTDHLRGRNAIRL